jgi:hypothetical protein
MGAHLLLTALGMMDAQIVGDLGYPLVKHRVPGKVRRNRPSTPSVRTGSISAKEKLRYSGLTAWRLQVYRAGAGLGTGKVCAKRELITSLPPRGRLALTAATCDEQVVGKEIGHQSYRAVRIHRLRHPRRPSPPARLQRFDSRRIVAQWRKSIMRMPA